MHPWSIDLYPSPPRTCVFLFPLHYLLRPGVCPEPAFEIDDLRISADATMIIPREAAQTCCLHPQDHSGSSTKSCFPAPHRPLLFLGCRNLGCNTSSNLLNSRPVLVAIHAPKVGGELFLYPKILLKRGTFFSPALRSQLWA